MRTRGRLARPPSCALFRPGLLRGLFVPLASGLACLFRVELMRMAAGVGRTAAQARNAALLLTRHGREAAPGALRALARSGAAEVVV